MSSARAAFWSEALARAPRQLASKQLTCIQMLLLSCGPLHKAVEQYTMQKDIDEAMAELYGHHCNLPHEGRGGSRNDFITSSRHCHFSNVLWGPPWLALQRDFAHLWKLDSRLPCSFWGWGCRALYRYKLISWAFTFRLPSGGGGRGRERRGGLSVLEILDFHSLVWNSTLLSLLTHPLV